MKRIFSVILSLFMVFSLQAYNTHRALIIGIGDYPASGGWDKINGDKDIPIVEKMLLANGFSKKNITKLKNEQATYSAISTEIQNLISASQPGDFVYIHFSGHGQQITDTDGDEEDGYDEAWIPYDAGMQYAKGKYEGEHHIVDDQLNEWLHSIREKIGEEGKIIVVADACHSGSSTRGAEDKDKVVVRGTAAHFTIPATGKAQQSGRQSVPIEWITISACKPYQSNYEYNGMGSLTYALSQEAGNFNTLTNAQLRQRIRSHIQQVVRQTQTPVVELPQENETNTFF